MDKCLMRGFRQRIWRSKVGKALDVLIDDELLAQAARLQGLKTKLQGSAGRNDLAAQLLAQHLAEAPAGR